MLSTSINVIDDVTVRSLVTHRDAIEVIRSVYADYGRVGTVLSNPPAMLMAPLAAESAAFKVKGAHVPSQGISGFRLIADRMIDGRESTIDLCWVADSVTGKVLGVIDETWLHRVRTAMTGVVAMTYLARPKSRIATIIGAGQISNELPAGLAQAFDLDEIRIVSRRIETAQALAERNAGACPIRALASIDEAIEGADIVITCSSSESPLVHAAQLRPGMTLCSLGGGPELASDIVERADLLVVDDFAYACTIGSVHGWIEAGIAPDQLRGRISANIGEIAADPARIRRNESDVVVAVIQGMACCDLALAGLVLDRASGRRSAA
ncbi:NAD(P)-binding domain-containing protein [Bosea sp. BK604]|uniref:NAD(P)-binding domain-containing protein n=1 Tax=Bosea sp. BK604 TaxID=2512180 RepID=UPI0010E9BE1B|nr:NAD(P)-binding domain-containing protein [Bosea sp. BK604]TCR61342.1 ornithine cyclodeaminase [Bosea sp. BK604]